MKDKNVFLYCIKCGADFLSKSDSPRCPVCRSLRIVEHKDVSAKADVLHMKRRVDELEQEQTANETKFANMKTYIIKHESQINTIVNAMRGR